MLKQEGVECLILVIRRRVQEVVFAVRSLIHHLDPTTQHRANDFICLLDTDTGVYKY